ncbi:MAG: thiamine pyrophosphate-dependent enzyme, partial [Rhodospirillales bacterium]|nr:thiamine pyrophosphate-dependent enzyme [Rhodospirillales bacterium]
MGPTYLSMSTETLMDEWTPPPEGRQVPAKPRTLSPPEDIEKLAGLLAKAKNSVILTEAAGSEVETFHALVDLCDSLALPVVETPSAIFANFPKDHPMHQGNDFAPYKDEADLIVVIRTRVPWYPPSNRPANATVVIIDESPHRDDMAYQSLQADMYLEGDAAQTLSGLAQAAKAAGMDSAAVNERRARLSQAHDEMVESKKAVQAEARNKKTIDPIWLCAALSSVMPDDAVYVDEVTTHTPLLREHINWNEPQSLYTRQGGLGQGLGLSLGIKLANPDKPVVTLIGDGAFLYNPVLQSLGAARDYNLPTLIIIFNNKKYAAMQRMHVKMYPEGTAVETDTFHGTFINAPDYTKVAEASGAFGITIEDPEALEEGLLKALEAVKGGQAAIVDVRLA